MDIKEILFKLADISGVSGNEDRASELAMEYLKKYSSDVKIKNRNVIANIGERSNDKPHVLLDAHIDQIGMICTYITDDGFIKVGNVGGLDRRLLMAQRVIIHGKRDITGIIVSTPPHLVSSDEKKASKVPEIEDICIDTGYTKAELEEIVSLGDSITFATECKELIGGRVTGKSLDDRCGVVAILCALEQLQGEELPCSLSVVFSAQEEVGERGAKIAAYEINPDIAIAVDVSFAYTADDIEYKCGKMGEGAMIGISPSLSRIISEKLIETAKMYNIPYQIEVMSGLTSTNADQFSVTRCGVKACTVSIPLKYMHTPVEVMQISDIENTARLIAEFIRRCS
ncbi:MAG: M42 family metallopeptidase [Clostridiales bacterium]|jgi:putative aminopeptidase FrvX|nr:M42 family metallopeptidase [Clostridiales bacterium]